MAVDNGLLAPLAIFIIAGAYYFLSAQRIINEDFVDASVRQMVGLMYISDVGFNLVASRLSKSKGKKTASKKAPTGTPGLVLNLLPLTDLVGLVCAFEAIRLAGSGFHQTVGGASIPISCLLNVLITGKVFSTGQLTGISIVILGLAVKAKALLDSNDDDDDAAGFPAVAVAHVLVSCVGYALRGIAMEYLSDNGVDGRTMTMRMGVTGVAAWGAYTLAFTARDFGAKVIEPFSAASTRVGVIASFSLYASHAISRGIASGTITQIVRLGGATVLSLAQVTRASIIILLSSVAFCGVDERQCLDGYGIASAALVIAGSAYYGNAKSFEEELDDLIDPDVADEMDSVIGEAEEILEELVDLYVEEHGSEPTEDEFLAWTESLKRAGAEAERKVSKKAATPKKATPAKKPKKAAPAKAKETKSKAKETTTTRRRSARK
jgi:drug/metabolite transporter (DMT)-like permease